MALRAMQCAPVVRIPGAILTAMAFRYYASTTDLKLPTAPWVRHSEMDSHEEHHAVRKDRLDG